ncbi:hypothetical protein EPUS_03210 [Endocarpon pusillum Z07020]|uniref:Uncharacterized protein n=1 Tax=Endocarpon pusillum (strain Z07020 / HMAS-L-300199) TaxID=1263415 RepID=U1GS57_ENDPU|nr:uncharacterized protein EPUS_03210 [Endocarpon pusillum Z07020]ERF74826.1 hypothetical protein EPUS_03210 [Endocarpon pusillum Z07020]
MPPSPAKRRKTSPTTSVAAVSLEESESRSQPRTSTSGRASYQSPTKSSLSRSHPTILARSPGRRSSQGRAKGLRDDILLGKTVIESPGNPHPISTPNPAQKHDEGVRGDTVGSPAGPRTTPPTLQSPPTEVGCPFAHSAQAPDSQRSPLRPRQPTVRSQGASPTKPRVVPASLPSSKLPVANPQSHGFPARQIDATEPELPPTPTQLGLSPKPDRPRGLAASSSPSSRGSRRDRLRSGQLETSSPLKPKGKMLPARTEEMLGDTPDAMLAGETPESDVERRENGPPPEHETQRPRDDNEVPADTVEKRKVRNDLQTQLTRLQEELAQLESALDGGEDAEDDLDPEVLALLSTPNISCDPGFPDAYARPSLPSIRDPVNLDVNPLAFLRAFAPGDLRLVTTTKSSSMRGELHQVHTINISAPPPWPPHVFNATFRVSCDIEAKSIVSIRGADIRPRHGAGIKELRHWMEARLKNPLHKFDAGTLIWGLGMWWKTAVTRAQFFHHIDTMKIATKTPEPQAPYMPDEAVKATDVQALIPYIGKSFVELIPAEPYPIRASTNEARKYIQPRLLLKWDLVLDWAGEVHTEIDVAGTKVSAKGQEGLKKIFPELMRRSGLDGAVKQVVQICMGGSGKKRKIY